MGRGQRTSKEAITWRRKFLHVQIPREQWCLTTEWPGWYVVRVGEQRERPRVSTEVSREPRDSQRRKALFSHEYFHPE